MEKIYDMLRLLDQRKASGSDGIPARFLKLCCSVLAQPITTIINKSIYQSKVPVVWKSANITPIMKTKGNPSPNNCKPILMSVLPILSKILERTIYKQIQLHFLDNNILTSKQSGFRLQHSTQDVLIRVTDS